MSLENLLYLFQQPYMIGLIIITAVLGFWIIFGNRIQNWYQFKYQDFGTCRKCGGKQDNMWYLVCSKCYERQMGAVDKVNNSK